MKLAIYPEGHYYDGDKYDSCPLCGPRPEPPVSPDQNPEVCAYPPLDQVPPTASDDCGPFEKEGRLLDGRYRVLARGNRQLLRAEDVESGDRVRLYRTRLPLPHGNRHYIDEALYRRPGAIDAFCEGSDFYAVTDPRRPMGLPILEPVLPDLCPPFPPDARPAPAPSGRPVTDMERVCPHCLHVSDTPMGENCPSCGSYRFLLSDFTRSVGKPFKKRLAGRFLLGCLIYEGWELTVYTGWDERTSRPVEVIEYAPAELLYGKNEEAGRSRQGPYTQRFNAGLERFLSTASLYEKYGGQHGVPELAEAFRENGTGYIAAYLEEGQTLNDCSLDWHRSPAEAPVLEIVRGVAEAVKYLHLQGGAHTGLNLYTVFVTASGRVLLLIPYGPMPSLRLKPFWARRSLSAPELVAGGPVTPAADVWSMAGLCQNWVDRRVAQDPLFEEALSPDPEKRPPTPDAFLDRLERLLKV